MYLEGGGKVVFQKPELDGGFGVAKNRQHHYSEEHISALEQNATYGKNMRDFVKLISFNIKISLLISIISSKRK